MRKIILISFIVASVGLSTAIAYGTTITVGVKRELQMGKTLSTPDNLQPAINLQVTQSALALQGGAVK